MFVDVSALENDTVLRTRVCVVGSGPAGTTAAVVLAKKGFDVILIEAGGRHMTGESQAQFAGEVVGDPYYAGKLPAKYSRDRTVLRKS